MTENIFLGLGSNLGDRRGWLNTAIDRLIESKQISIISQSSLYETAPVGVIDQPNFYNQVVEIETEITPRELLALVQKIENELGRVRQEKWGPRNIDLDILAFDRCKIDLPDLKIPHPEIPHRRFVLEPWAEIAAHFRLPVWNRSVAELVAHCKDRSAVVRIKDSVETTGLKI